MDRGGSNSVSQIATLLVVHRQYHAQILGAVYLTMKYSKIGNIALQSQSTCRNGISKTQDEDKDKKRRGYNRT
jgi:hypothetical protein